jgi:rfaE bifunctional protein nucleotidyltransferase chain/domain
MSRGHVLSLDDLATTIRELQEQGKKVVHSHGVFDLLHVGHIRHFEQAKAMGDVLVVTLTEDQHVNKGPHRPAFPQHLRAEGIAALGVVDFVAINRWPLSVETIRLLRPNIYVKGSDYASPEKDATGGISLEAEAARSVGADVCFTDDIVFSSSALLNRHFSAFSPEVVRYLEEFRRRHSADEVLQWLDRAASLRPLAVGEAIVDEYIFCDGIGKSTKDPVLAVLHKTTAAYAGGSLAVANHLAGLCDSVRLVTQLGDRERAEDVVRASLKPNVEAVFLTKHDSPTIHKRRVVDHYTGNKLLEIYEMNDALTTGDDAANLGKAIEDALSDRDVTVVTDYGHGMMTSCAIDALCKGGSFLAVNVQANAGNQGFNRITKYGRADYVCLANHELAVETRQRDGVPADSVKVLAERIDCARFTVTLGKGGSVHYDRGTQSFTEAPALASRVVDRVGAGDSVLAVTALMLAAGAPWDIVAFLGNVAGAELVAELGNRKPLDRVSLGRHITTLLK